MIQKITYVALVILAFAGILMLNGCEGAMGPAGRDAEGEDIIPPTVKIIEPRPLFAVYDSFTIQLAAVDNASISEARAMFDGSAKYGDNLLVTKTQPYSFEVNLWGVLSDSSVDGRSRLTGWHYITGRAIDPAGNYSDSPVIPIWVGFSKDLSDTTVTLSHFGSEAVSLWKIPSSLRAVSYWVKIKAAKDSQLKRIGANLAGVYSDTSGAWIRFSIWEGAEIPNTQIANTNTEMLLLDLDTIPRMYWFSYENDTTEIEGRKDIFLVLSLHDASSGDTVMLGSDNGNPAWDLSGCRDDVGWHTLRERYAVNNNFMISADLYYDFVAGGD